MAKHALLAKRCGVAADRAVAAARAQGAHRVDDRRVISGIVHMLRSGRAGVIARRSMALTRRSTIASIAGAAGDLDRYLLCSDRLDRDVRIGLGRFDLHQGPPLGGGRKRGAFNNAIGRSRGGQTTKIHALTDDIGRPHALLITAGNTHDLVGARRPARHGPSAQASSGRPSLRRQQPARGARCSAASKPSSRQTRPASIPIATTKLPTRAATSSSACSAGSRTSDASQLATTSAPTSSSPPSSWPLP